MKQPGLRPVKKPVQGLRLIKQRTRQDVNLGSLTADPKSWNLQSSEETALKFSLRYPESCHSWASRTTVVPLEKVKAFMSTHPETYSFLPYTSPSIIPRESLHGFLTHLCINRKTGESNTIKRC